MAGNSRAISVINKYQNLPIKTGPELLTNTILFVKSLPIPVVSGQENPVFMGLLVLENTNYPVNYVNHHTLVILYNRYLF